MTCTNRPGCQCEVCSLPSAKEELDQTARQFIAQMELETIFAEIEAAVNWQMIVPAEWDERGVILRPAIFWHGKDFVAVP